MSKVLPRSMMRFFKINIILSFFIAIGLFTLYSFRLTDSYFLTTDFGRDLYNIIKIAQGNLILIGPKMNFGGYYAGPYYYYLFVPILWISRFNVDSILYFNNLLFVIASVFFFYIVSQKLTTSKAFFGMLAISLSPLYIICARYPSNGYTYLPFLWILLTIVLFLKYDKKIALVILGTFCGVIINIHPITLFVLIFIISYIFITLPRKKLIYFFLIGFIPTFLPLILFELTHNFVMTYDTFINHSYLSMLKNNSQFYPIRQNLLINYFFISGKLKELLTLQPITYLVIISSIIFIEFKRKKIYSKQSNFLLISSIISLLLLVNILRFYFEYHYIFPMAFLLLFSLTVILIRSSFWWLIGILILLEVIFFPTSILKIPNRSYKDLENSVKFVIDQKLITRSEPFNLIQVLDAYNLVPVGFEYRFFFRKYGFMDNSEYDYQNAKKLIIFSETPYYDIDQFKMWATEQFGRNYFTNRQVYKLGKTTIYIISKK